MHRRWFLFSAREREEDERNFLFMFHRSYMRCARRVLAPIMHSRMNHKIYLSVCLSSVHGFDGFVIQWFSDLDWDYCSRVLRVHRHKMNVHIVSKGSLALPILFFSKFQHTSGERYLIDSLSRKILSFGLARMERQLTNYDSVNIHRHLTYFYTELSAVVIRRGVPVNDHIHLQWLILQLFGVGLVKMSIIMLQFVHPPIYTPTQIDILPNFRHPIMDNQSVMSSETDSLGGNFIDVALGSDFDGITDGELNEELHKEANNENQVESSDEEDNINVTIREIVKPHYKPKDLTSNEEKQPTVGKDKPRLASVVVVPTRPSQNGAADPVSTAVAKEARHGTKKNRTGSAKRARTTIKKNTGNASNSGNNLLEMLTRVKVSGSNNSIADAEASSLTPKRTYSPDDKPDMAHPSKRFQKSPHAGRDDSPTEPSEQPTAPIEPPTALTELQIPPTAQSSMPIDLTTNSLAPLTESRENGSLSYRDVTLLSLQFIVCLEGRPNLNINDSQNIKRLINKKIEGALINRTATPIVKYMNPKQDGVYVGCADSTCANWLHATMNGVVPWENCQGKLVVIPQTDSPKLIRTVVCVPTTRSNDFILDIMAQLNQNLNVKDWIIKSRRPVGSGRSFKTTLFIRMDTESVERLKPINYRLNWIGGTVQVNLERTQSKPQLENPIPVDNSTVSEGHQLRGASIATSSSEAAKAKPGKHGLSRRGGSASSGRTHSKKLDG